LKLIPLVTSLLLLASGAVGAEIILTDGWLRSASPYHAYGLVAFVVIDLFLAGASWGIPRLATKGSGLFGTIQFAGMIADIFAGQPTGVPVGVWEGYLVGDAFFMALLGIQAAIVGWAALSARMISNQTRGGPLAVKTTN